MKTLLILDKKDYTEDMPVFEKFSTRAIIIRDGKIATQHGNAGDYKILGGGVEPGEDIHEALIREVQEETGLHIRSPQLCGIKDWCEDQCRFVVLLYKTTCFDGELHSSSEGRVWWEDIANLPNLKLSLDMRDMLRVFKEENLSEFFYYQESSAWKYVLK